MYWWPSRCSRQVRNEQIPSPSGPSTPRPGIEHYWIVELGPPITLAALHLASEFGYQESPAVTGTFTTNAPVPLRLDLDAVGE